MRITVHHNGKKVKKDIPDSWEKVTFQMYIDLLGVDQKDATKILSVFTGIDEQTLKRSKIEGLQVVLDRLSFLTTTSMDESIPKAILGFPIPKDLNFETTGQYGDLEFIAASFPKEIKEGETLGKEHMAKYAEIVAIYAQPDYLDKTSEQQAEFVKQFYSAPCQEVLAVGNFTLIRFIGWKLNIRKTFLRSPTRITKLRQAILGYRARLVSSLRFWRLRRLLRTPATS